MIIVSSVLEFSGFRPDDLSIFKETKRIIYQHTELGRPVLLRGRSIDHVAQIIQLYRDARRVIS